jgi:hypothetical protein
LVSSSNKRLNISWKKYPLGPFELLLNLCKTWAWNYFKNHGT